MKRLLIVLLLIIDSLASAKIYYVSPQGKDSNTGYDITKPWATWQYAFNNTPAGDTCYFRGGIYTTNSRISIINNGHDGTYSHPTCFFNYPGEIPTMSASSFIHTAAWNYPVLLIQQMTYLYFKGLEIKNYVQRKTTGEVPYGVKLYNTGNIKFENMNVHHIDGIAFHTEQSDTTLFINCDAHDLCDYLTGYDPGGAGTGFVISGDASLNSDIYDSYVLFKGCRVWKASDNGWGACSDGLVEWDSCWAINIGYYWDCETEPSENDDYGYNGNGWKYDQTYTAPSQNKVIKIMTHCVAAYCEYHGFAENYGAGTPQAQYYNNFAYKNGNNGIHYNGTNPGAGWGFKAWGRSDTTGIYSHCYRNNLSYKNGPQNDKMNSEYVMENNFWYYPNLTSNPSVTDDDFISLDTLGMCGPRQKNGKLPYVLFGHLAEGSNLIDAGTPRTGLKFNGAAPDVGWVESQPGSNMYPSITITSPSSGSKFTPPATVNIIVNALDGDGTISKVEFFVGTTKLDEKTSNPWSIVWDSIPAGTYSLTAVATDNLGAKTTSSAILMIVGNSTATNKAPVINISNPVTGSTFTAPATIVITANASDADGAISKVEFFNGTTLLYEKTSNPWSYTLTDAPVGTYTLTAAATDNSGARTISSVVTIIVNNLPPVVNQLPLVSISNPTKGKKFIKHASITIDAVASDPDGTIIKVEFFNGYTELAELTTAPWSFTWKDVDVGTYIITAMATDNLDATTVSSPVDVVVEEDITTSFYDVNSEILKLYPNPNNGQFTIELIEPLQNERIEITIATFEGRLIDKEILSQDKKQFDLSYLKPGTYILILSGKDIIVTKKFIRE